MRSARSIPFNSGLETRFLFAIVCLAGGWGALKALTAGGRNARVQSHGCLDKKMLNLPFTVAAPSHVSSKTWTFDLLNPEDAHDAALCLAHAYQSDPKTSYAKNFAGTEVARSSYQRRLIGFFDSCTQVPASEGGAPAILVRDDQGEIVGVLITDAFSTRYLRSGLRALHPIVDLEILPEFRGVLEMVRDLEVLALQAEPELSKIEDGLILHLLTMGVLPSVRRCGLGQELMRVGLKVAQQLGYTFAIAECSTQGSQKMLTKKFGGRVLAELPFTDYLGADYNAKDVKESTNEAEELKQLHAKTYQAIGIDLKD